MAKKILAVVLAVMIAVSAMAISAFAAEEINLYVTPYDPNGLYGEYNGYGEATYSKFTVSYDIPLYALYGYMDSDHYMEFVLPAKELVGNTTVIDEKISWSLIVNGKEYVLKAGNHTEDFTTNKVYFGYATHNYVEGYDTTIPQSTAYGDITSVRLVATVVITGDQWASWCFSPVPANKGTAYYVQFHNNDKDGTEVVNSRSFIKDWNGTVAYDDAVKKQFNTAWATPDLDTTWYGTWSAAQNEVANLISFDHTLANRQTIINAVDGATLVVELANEMVGQASYTLWAKMPSTNVGSNWWQYKSSRVYVDTAYLDGKQGTLEFNVPQKVLWDSNYGVMVEQFVIFENITLFNSALMTSYLRFDTNGWSGSNDHAINLNTNGSGSIGRLSWAWGDKVNYDGAQVRYAAGGLTSIKVLGTETVETPATPDREVPVVKIVYSDKEYEAGAIDKMVDLVSDAEGIVAIDKTTGDYVVKTEKVLDGEGKETGETKVVYAKAPYQLVPVFSDGWEYAKDEQGNLIPLTDEDGNLYRDADGNLVYKTVPAPGSVAETVTIPGTEAKTEVKDIVNPNYAVPNEDATPAQAKTIKLVFGTDEGNEVEQPAEGTDQEEEGEEVDETPTVEAPEEEEPAPAPAPAPSGDDANPGTGVALAVVPMLIAAAAAVVSKKH